LEVPEPEEKSSDEEEGDSSDDDADQNDLRVDITTYKLEETDEFKQSILEDASEDEIYKSSDDDEEFEVNFPIQSTCVFCGPVQ
jgi:hypothetical protein